MRSHVIAVLTARAVRAAIAAAIVAVAVTACNGGVTGPNPTACKEALQAQYVKALAGKAHFETNLPACEGLPAAQVQRFAQEVQEG